LINNSNKVILNFELGRKGYMAGEDKQLTAMEVRREERELAEARRLEREAKVDSETVELASSTSSSTGRSPSLKKKCDPDFSLKPCTSTSQRRGRMDVVTPSVAAALDRTGISNRQAAHILSATVDNLGLPVYEFTLNRIYSQKKS
jgi:hypothetical protein